MMENFTKILWQLLITAKALSSSNNFGDSTPFKVKANFDIPLFDIQIDVFALGKLLN